MRPLHTQLAEQDLPIFAQEQVDRVAKVFNGTYTVTSPTGEHRTFDIKTQKEYASFAPGQRTIALLTGPNNEDDYQGFGFVTDEGIRVWNKKKGTREAPSLFERYADLVWSLATEGEQSRFYIKGARLLVEGRCIRCNRKLTNPTSIISGIGPECAKRD